MSSTIKSNMQNISKNDISSTDTESKSRWCRKTFSPLVALTLACICGAATGIANTFAKVLNNVGAFTISSVRFSIIFVISFSIVIYRREEIFPRGIRLWLIARSVVGVINSIAIYFAVKHMPIGDMTMIAASSTVFVCIYGRIFLKEEISKINILNILIVVCGIFLITKPTFIFGNLDEDAYTNDKLSIYAITILAVLSIFLFPAISISLRALRVVHWSVILSVFGFVGSISTFILAILIDGKMITEHIFPASTLEWAALLGVGFSSFVVQISFTQALKYEMAATVSLERKAADVIFAFLYQVTIFMEVPTAYSVGGAILIFLALLISGISAIKKENERNRNKKKLKDKANLLLS